MVNKVFYVYSAGTVLQQVEPFLQWRPQGSGTCLQTIRQEHWLEHHWTVRTHFVHLAHLWLQFFFNAWHVIRVVTEKWLHKSICKLHHWAVIQVFVFLQRGGRERHAIPRLADDEEPGEAGDCEGSQDPETGTASLHHGHRWEMFWKCPFFYYHYYFGIYLLVSMWRWILDCWSDCRRQHLNSSQCGKKLWNGGESREGDIRQCNPPHRPVHTDPEVQPGRRRGQWCAELRRGHHSGWSSRHTMLTLDPASQSAPALVYCREGPLERGSLMRILLSRLCLWASSWQFHR